MPSAKARAAKAVIAARVAAVNAAADEAAALALASASPSIHGGAVRAVDVNAQVPTVPTPLQPTLPSMLNLNTAPNMYCALSVGQVTKTGGTANAVNGSTSDEENVQPPGLSVAPSSASKFGADANTDVDQARPMSPPLSPVIGGVLGKDRERDMRAFELDRQRMKKAGELARRKAKKAAVAAGRVSEYGGDAGRRGRRVISSRLDVDGDTLDESNSVLNKASGVRTEAGGIQVNLSDLMVFSQKKPRKLLEDDFEFIPAVRSVIVLDDMADARDMDLDEPWEHIENDFDMDGVVRSDKEGGAEPSYAAILAGR